MFATIEELTLYYAQLYGISFDCIETLPKFMFSTQNREIFKRYKKSLQELKKFERREKRALNNYWKYKERGDIKNMKHWLKKIKFLKDKRSKIVYKIKETEEKNIAKN